MSRRPRPLRRSVGLLLFALALFLAWNLAPWRLPEAAPYRGALPPATPPAGMSLSALPTGTMQSRAAFAYSGGSLLEARTFAMTPVLIRHPRGDLLVDAGFGRDVDAHVAGTPRLAQALTRYEKGTPAAAQLQAQGIAIGALAGVLLTHAHWDHVSGLADLAGTPVWITAEERDFVRDGGERSALARGIEPVAWREYAFEGGEYLGFPRSHDVWGDGSVVVVPAPGHTPGSVIVFVALPSGARYALLGDLVWQLEGITRPAERPWFARRMLGEDDARVRAAIARVAALHRAHPQIHLLPAHDARAFAALPVFPAAAR